MDFLKRVDGENLSKSTGRRRSELVGARNKG